MKGYLEICVIKCPKCGNYLVEPSWFVEVSANITCSCVEEIAINKKRIKDKKMLEIEIENGKIKSVQIIE